MRALIHIGSGKTGTTSVQEALARSSRQLQANGYLYPVIDRTPNHNYLAAPFKQRQPRRLVQRHGNLENAKRVADEKWNNVRVTAAREKPHTLVLSAEYLFHSLDVTAFMDCLHHHVPGITSVDIIAYLRRPSSYYLSRSQQELKGSPSFAVPRKQSYVEHLMPWAEVGDVHLAEFNRRMLVDGDVVQDFWKRYLPGLDCPFEPGGVSENVGLSAESLGLLQRYWLKWFPDHHDVFLPETSRLQNLLRRIERVDGERLNITRPRLHENIAEFLDFPWAEIAALKEQLGFEFEGIPQPSPGMTEPKLPDRPYLRVEDIMSVNLEALAALQKTVVAKRQIPFMPAWKQARQVAELSLDTPPV